MQIVLDATSRVAAVHADGQDVAAAYPGCVCVTLPDAPVEIGQELAVDLETVRAAARAAIDAEAEARRQLVLTPGAGQMAAYQRKEAQARAYVADPVPEPADYPALVAEVGATASTLSTVAQAVVARADIWHAYGDAIEAARLGAKKAVAGAADVAAVVAAADGVVWPEAGGAV
ncbi:hypothetical protein [Desulfolutivibrio sulfoxidireducens]|uniref:hypothetical protein n=1 Tax=Desulfolutivibrio sulfoxidireducens TaxID=2773299 RepID=UPI00159D9512|nr:hypothetical protein [Desulfolutivibrio sulfoxidireducens]QLA21266.1 hypothetical protein GD604_16820 [Desulfolutivibrio sulfoxidireducens]